MEKEILEKVLIKAVKYYFKGLSAKEAVNKALEEIKEQFEMLIYVWREFMNNKKMDYFGCEINYSCNECECFESDTSSKKEFLCCKYCFNNVICCEECTKNNESFEIITR